MNIPIEDNYEDVLGKARRGNELEVGELARKAGVSENNAHAVLEGHFEENIVKALADALGLNAEALVSLGKKDWYPEVPEVDGLKQFTTHFGLMLVNSYLVWDSISGKGVAFDSGASAAGMIKFLEEQGIELEMILLTHSHQDHVVDLVALKDYAGTPVYISEEEEMPGCKTFRAGHSFRAGKLNISTRATVGHSRGGITYVAEGLATPVAIVGDALFAGSMGGGMFSYPKALESGRKEIFSLPENTILCPGHGPMTTLVQETRHNPFFA